MLIGVVAVIGLFALALIPIGRLILLAHQLGFVALTSLMVVESLVIVVRTLSPLRSSAWFKPIDAGVKHVTLRVIGLELATSALAVALLATTASLWQPIFHITPPLWLIALIALRCAGSSALVRIASLQRPVGLVLALVELVVVLPLVALFGGSLATVVIGSTILTWTLAVLAARMPVMDLAKLGKRNATPADKPAESSELLDRWQLGSWLGSLMGNLWRPALTAFGGLAIVVPASAVFIVNGLLVLPWFAVVTTKQPRSWAARWFRGIVASAASILIVHELGPAIYRFAFPATFGDGEWLRILAWGGLALLPMSLRVDPTHASQLRIALAAVISAVALVVLGWTYGLEGVWLAFATAGMISGAIGMTSSPTSESVIAG